MSGERTEEATPQRREQARKQGQIPRSQELQTAAVLLGGMMALNATGMGVVDAAHRAMGESFGSLKAGMAAPDTLAELVMPLVTGLAFAAVPVIATVWVASAVVGVGQGGLAFTGKGLTPDFSRLNPMRAIKRWFSMDSVMLLVRDLAKLGMVGYNAHRLFSERQPDLARLPEVPLSQGMALAYRLCLDVAMQSVLMFAVLAAADYVYQRWQFEKSIRMTKQEVKEELRQSEGDPQIKARIRQLARKFARSRMMAAVPKATVVLTNPTHLSVALEYRPGEMAAPRVVAKGEGAVALRIREIAKKHDVPMVENKPLAWAIHGASEVGDYVPAELYTAVAEVLAFVMSLRRSVA